MQDLIPRRIDINQKIDAVTVKQFDNDSRYIHVTITDIDLADGDGNAFDLAGCSAAIYIQPEGCDDPDAVSFVDGTVESAESGIVTFLLPGGVTRTPGRYECEIWIYQGDDQSRPIISTKPFELIVEKSIRNDSAIEATQSFSALDAKLIEVQSLRNEMNALASLADQGEIPAGSVQAEVIDARTGSDGLNFINLGEAVRSLQSGYRQLNFEWTFGTVDQNGGDAPASTVKRSAYIPVGLLRGVTLVIDSQEELSSPERVNSWLYYADKSPYRRGTSYTVSSVIGNIPDDAAFVRFIAAEQTIPKVSMTVLARSYDLSLKSQIESIETVELNWEPGSIDNSGAEISDASRLRSGFISRDALAGSTMYIDGSIAPNRVNGYLYDKNKKFILRYGTYSETGAVVNPTTNPPWRYARFVCMATDRNLIRVGCDNSSRLANTEETVTQLLAAIPDQSVSSLNSDREHLLYSASQSCAPRLRGGSVDDPPGTALGFIHFSDVHGTLISWKRLGAYLNQHTNLFSFALHTGDYVPSNQGNYNESVNNLYRLVQTDKPVLNCLGNHDVLLSDGVTKNPDPSAARSLLFADIDNWGVNQPSDDVMYYYRDFDDVRLIVLDQYYADSAEHTWLTNLLDDARISGKAVITASHTQTAPITHTIGTFNDIDRPSAHLIETNGFESAIKSFRDDGGTHICHLGGHWHWDVVGTTDNGILNILVECATIYGGGYRNDIRRTGVNKPEGASRAYDCFNAVFVDTFTHTIRIIRIGSNTDNYLHPKNTMCIDYTTGNLISNT